jgi:hypothetical protein
MPGLEEVQFFIKYTERREHQASLTDLPKNKINIQRLLIQSLTKRDVVFRAQDDFTNKLTKGAQAALRGYF